MAKKSLFSQSSQQKAPGFLGLRLPRHFALSSSRRSESVTVTMDSATTFVAVYDTKPYDREYLSAAARMGGVAFAVSRVPPRGQHGLFNRGSEIGLCLRERRYATFDT